MGILALWPAIVGGLVWWYIRDSERRTDEMLAERARLLNAPVLAWIERERAEYMKRYKEANL